MFDNTQPLIDGDQEDRPGIDVGESEIRTYLSNPEAPYQYLDIDKLSKYVHPNSINTLREGGTLHDILEANTDDFFFILKNLSVVQMGTFKAKDSLILDAFGSHTMLTRGFQTCNDPRWKDNWETYFKSLEKKSKLRRGQVRREHYLNVGVYSLALKNIAGQRKNDVLDILVEKTLTGAIPVEVWSYPVVRALINYHWDTWARSLCLLTFYLMLCWSLSFTIYLILYIEWNGDISIYSAANSGTITAFVLNCISFGFMIPFFVKEILEVHAEGFQWITFKNVIHTTGIVIQMIIFCCHLANSGFGEFWFGVLLSIQMLILYVRILRFVRIVGEGIRFFRNALEVIYEVRYWLLFIVVTGIIASFMISVLYIADPAFQNLHGDYAGVSNSLVTTFQIIFGNFESDMIFDAKYQWLQILVFFGFQILITITFLNLVIAAMSDAYALVASDKQIQYYKERTVVIQELTHLYLPKCLSHDLDPYIHFAIIENKGARFPDEAEDSSKIYRQLDDLQKEFHSFHEKLDTLIEAMKNDPRLHR